MVRILSMVIDRKMETNLAVILASVGASRLLAGEGSGDGLNGTLLEVSELECLN